jgi:hypothetical protein
MIEMISREEICLSSHVATHSTDTTVRSIEANLRGSLNSTGQSANQTKDSVKMILLALTSRLVDHYVLYFLDEL